METMKDTLEDTVRASFAGVVWSHKIHEKQADLYFNSFRRMETLKIICSILTSVGIVAMIVKDPLWLKLVSAAISGTGAFISTYFQSFKTQEQIDVQKKVARELLSLMDKYIHLLLAIRLGTENIEDSVANFEKLESEKHEIYRTAPITTDKAVTMARDALCISNDNNYSDSEIDNMLPSALKKVNKSGS